MENGGVECENCGGTDFYKEAGFYYCSECQIQTQDIQEHLFEEQTETADLTTLKPKGKRQSRKAESSITSWEAYNYILLGLTNELIQLGADPRLKPVVKILWLKYLEKLQVINLNTNVTPKLGSTNKKNAEIIYGLPKRKRKRSASTHSSASTELDSTLLTEQQMRRESAKKRRALIAAYSQEFSQRSRISESSPNDTLTTLRSDRGGGPAPRLALNRYASRALRKKMTKSHLRRHERDLDAGLRCHNVSGRRLGRYINSGVYLSPNKPYALLNLALLIVKDAVHLSDILRFIDEGRLSVNDYGHFFPEDFHNKSVNFVKNRISFKLTWHGLQGQTLEVADALGVLRYLSRPNLVELAARYCAELNLPTEFCRCVQSLISRLRIASNYGQVSVHATNYEGRVLAVILVVLKLLFGLDDVNEHRLSRMAGLVNVCRMVEGRMFDVVGWLRHLQYRRIMIEYSYYACGSRELQFKDLNDYFGLMSSRPAEEGGEPTKLQTNLTLLLKHLKKEDGLKKTNFGVSFTPFRDFTKLLVCDPNCKVECLLPILNEDYTDSSLEFVLKPADLVTALNKGEDPKLVHCTANENFVIERVYDLKKEQKEASQLIMVELSEGGEGSERTLNDSFDPVKFSDIYERKNMAGFMHNLRLLKKYSKNCNLPLKHIETELKDFDAYSRHFIPHDRYWLRFISDTMGHNDLSTKCYEEFFDKFPNNFKLVFRECQLICQQNLKTFMKQFLLTEVYLAYATDQFTDSPNDQLIKAFLMRNLHFW